MTPPSKKTLFALGRLLGVFHDILEKIPLTRARKGRNQEEVRPIGKKIQVRCIPEAEKVPGR